MDWLDLYLREDVDTGDATSEAIFDARHKGAARIVARERLFVAGVDHAADVFRRLGATATPRAADGTWVDSGATLLDVKGPTRAILTGERLALNVVARMSGIASATRLLVEELARGSCGAVVAGTRKTTPGFRAFEKEAIRIGGGDPHRSGLWDEAMVKDNHLEALAGGTTVGPEHVREAVRRVRAAQPRIRLTCEVESLDAALAAARAGADWLLIDNQSPETGRAWAEAVWMECPQTRIEASGGITPANVAAYGWADRVSLGWLTQKVHSKDVSMDWEATHE